jgi:N5-(cytidine 5'-diphosphoramidyl)-L-glutamine hydrolase
MRIGITQRVEYVTAYEEARDCLDQRWPELLDVLKMTTVPIPNTLRNVDEWLEIMKCDAYILTGGNDLSDLPNAKNISVERDRTEMALLRYAQSRSLPVLGVCRGLQLMNVFFGGKLERVSGHIASRHKIRMYFDEEKQFIERDVNSFHNWGISINGLAKQLTPSAYDSKDFIEAARNEKLNWLGIMWHPEREERFEASDLEILTKLFNEGSS